MISLRRLNCGAEEDDSIFSEKMRNSPEKRPWILQVLCEHGSNNSLVLSPGALLIDIKRVLDLEGDAIAMS